MTNHNILILGKNGQMSNAIAALLHERALIAGPPDLDFLQLDFLQKLEAWLDKRPISAVINAAAYTQVDKAEQEGKEDAFRLNATAVGELAVWCTKRTLPLVHYSTDYVFDGNGDTPRHEEDKTSPLNAYGASKLAGEHAIMQAGGDYLILRTSWIYDAMGKNFFTTMCRLMREKESLNVVADQIGAPTYATHLATATLAALKNARANKTFPSGLYHLCNAGETSWHGFAQAIHTYLKAKEPNLRCQDINPIPSSAYPTPAKRPLNSRLDCSKIRDTLQITMPHWQEGLKECFSAT